MIRHAFIHWMDEEVKSLHSMKRQLKIKMKPIHSMKTHGLNKWIDMHLMAIFKQLYKDKMYIPMN